MQDRSLAQADSSRRRVGRGLVELEAPVPVSPTWRLGVRQSSQKGQATVSAWVTVSSPSEAGAGSSRDSGQCGMAYARHTFGTLMKANGEDIKTIQELLRHSNYKVTADTYTQAVTPMKRAAQTKLVKMILLPTKKVGEERASSE